MCPEKTVVNINDDRSHLSKQRQVSVLTYSNLTDLKFLFSLAIVLACTSILVQL